MLGSWERISDVYMTSKAERIWPWLKEVKEGPGRQTHLTPGGGTDGLRAFSEVTWSGYLPFHH